MNKRHIFPLLAGILFSPFLLFGSPLENVTLQLRWLHQFQFAGYYMAKNKGYYRDAGLNVTILEANKSHPQAVEEVVSGRAQYGVGNSGLIDERLNGKPIIVLAALFQTSPNIWIIRKDANVSTTLDLAHKRLMMGKDIENAELMALFHNEGININKLNVVENTFNIDDLVNGKVDAYNGYSTNEPYYLKEKGFAYTTIDPRQYGIDFYSDCLFTSDKELSQHPERVKAFREASLRGWAYALAHPEETIDVILSDYSHAKTRDHLRFEATAIHRLMEPELIEIGHMNPVRWKNIVQTYHELGFCKSDTVPNGFLYNPNQPKDYRWLYYSLSISLLLLLGVGAIAVYIYRLNGKIKEQSIHDPLTGLHNRYYLNEVMPQELERAERESIPLSIVIIDIDHFKTINDTYGHAAGDEVLKGIAACLIQSVRKNDFLFRYGGEEFVIIIPKISYEQAMQRMETCRQEIQDMRIHYEGADLLVTISGGIAVYSLHGTTQDSLLMVADKALYCSKKHGRNQITLAPLKNPSKESL